MPLGDSITQGDCNHDSYRRALWHALTNAGDNFTFVGTWETNFGNCLPPDPDFVTWNQGQWGVPASSVVGGAQGYEAQDKADIVIMHLGTNDLANSQDAITLQNTIANLGKIIDNLRAANPQVIVLMAQIIPCTDLARNMGITELNAMIPGLVAQKTMQQSPVLLVDMNTGYDAAANNQIDGLHPNPVGEYLIAQRWFTALEPILHGSTSYNPAPVTMTAAPPAPVSITFPAAGQTVSGTISVTATVSLTLDASGSYLMVDGHEFGTFRVTNPPFAYPLDTTLLADGSHTLVIWAHDTNNDTVLSEPVSIAVNNSGGGTTTTSPTPVAITSPAMNQTVRGVITVTATIKPTLDAAGSYLMVDGYQASVVVTNPPFAYPLDTTKYANGAHRLVVWAHDINNQVDLSPAITIQVAN